MGGRPALRVSYGKKGYHRVRESCLATRWADAHEVVLDRVQGTGD